MAGSRVSFLPLCILFAGLFFQTANAGNLPFYNLNQILENAVSKPQPQRLVIKPAYLVEIDSSSDPDKKILLSGEGGLSMFDTGADGQFPNAEFRVDEAKLFVDASPGAEVYFFAELNFTTRESIDEFEVGELYADFENISRFWSKEEQLNVRFGRMDIPLGEEYMTRDAIDNPLISHSLADVWGVDEGIEAYGRFGKAQYVFAVQNGGIPKFHDYTTSKSVAGRFSYDFTPHIHASVSALNTGALDVKNDVLSAIWFGNGFLRSLGSPATTTEFRGKFLQGDGQIQCSRGSVNASAGILRYSDNDTAADNSRDVSYYSLGGVLSLIQEGQKLYSAMQYSRISADQGFPLVGNGNFGEYFFSPDSLTQSLWRLSLGIGFRPHKNVLLKGEYNFERGELLNGGDRSEEDFVGVEAALRF